MLILVGLLGCQMRCTPQAVLELVDLEGSNFLTGVETNPVVQEVSFSVLSERTMEQKEESKFDYAMLQCYA